MAYKTKTKRIREQKIDKLIYRLGKVEDKLSEENEGNFIIEEDSEKHKKLVAERLNIEKQISKLN